MAEFHPLRRAVRACAGGRSAHVAACATAEPATAADPDMSAEAVRTRIEAARIKAENELIDYIRSHADAIGFPGELGVSRAVNGICLRVLTTRGDDAFDLIKDVSDFVVA